MDKRKFLKHINKVQKNIVNSNPVAAYLVLTFIGWVTAVRRFFYERHGFSETEHYNCNPSSVYDLELITVSFNNYKIIEKQIELIKKNIVDNYHLTIVDNSTDSEMAGKIKDVCLTRHVGYIKLPNIYMPLPNYSHGFALNWTFKNYISQLKVKYFGFLDHDILPTKKMSMLEKIDGAYIYGPKHTRSFRGSEVWYIWPGFCFFNFDYIKNKKINFCSGAVYDLHGFSGMDTGGQNWRYIYKYAGNNKVKFSESQYFEVDEKTGEWCSMIPALGSDLDNVFEVIDGWFHLRRLHTRENFTESKFFDEIVNKIN